MYTYMCTMFKNIIYKNIINIYVATYDKYIYLFIYVIYMYVATYVKYACTNLHLTCLYEGICEASCMYDPSVYLGHLYICRTT